VTVFRLTGRWRWALALLTVACLAAGAALWVINDLHSARWQVASLPAQTQNDMGPRVIRGPYLQSMGATSVVVRWRTDVPTQSLLRFSQAQPEGAADAGLALAQERVEQVAEATTEHELTLRHLAPATSYNYSIGQGSDVVAGVPTPWGFRTAPEAGDAAAKKVRVWALGDSGTATAGARAVRDAFLKYTQGQLPDVWLMLGDNAYNTGTDVEFQAAVFETYPDLLARLSLWPTRGNHDQSQSPGHVAYFDIFSLPKDASAGGQPSGTEAYYSFDHGAVHFVCLDSYATSRKADAPMAQWLVRDLQNSTARWKVAFFHHPPYTRGTHDSDHERTMIEMRNNIVPLLETGSVDLVLSGHSHNYERSGLMASGHKLAAGGNGVVFHKRPGPRTGTVYVVAGASGELGRKFTGLDHPAMEVSATVLGSLSLELQNDTAVVRYVDANAQVFDTFSLQKDPLQ